MVVVKAVELVLYGYAVVVDVALLLALLGRVNRGRVAVWLKSLVAGTAVVHAAIFARLMLQDGTGPLVTVIDRLLVLAICGGLLTLPSAMLHAAGRLHRTGIFPRPPHDRRYAWLYLPLLLLPLIAIRVWQMPQQDFLTQLGPWTIAYLVWLVFANMISMVLFWRLRGRMASEDIDAFLSRLSIGIAIITALCVGYALIANDTSYETPLRLLATLSPLGVSLLFVWHSLRGRLMPLVMERTFGYAVFLLGIALTNRLVIAPLNSFLKGKSNFDLLLIEGILVALVVLVVPSFRARVAESLRYLFSSNVLQVRDATRQLSLRLSQNASLDRDELVQWFANELRQSIALDQVTILLDRVSGETQQVVRSASDYEAAPQSTSAELMMIHRAAAVSDRDLERGAIDDTELNAAFDSEAALIAFPLAYRSITGTVVLGNRFRNDRLAQEQINALSLVVDQFAATLHNRYEERLRQQAERRILQQEKLSVLGLMSGSLAHELRNPLSSMRTIATLTIEELGTSHPCNQDLQLIVAEIDRLSQTTNRLLEFAKPEPQSPHSIFPDQVTLRIVSILEHLARQYHVETSLHLQCADIRITANEASLSEIIFNLVKNAIEAAKETEVGKVVIESRSVGNDVVILVSDNGAGIAEEIRQTLFQPFATYKPDGNGLGLYAAAERVRELRGTIEFRHQEPRGTVFEVRLPVN